MLLSKDDKGKVSYRYVKSFKISQYQDLFIVDVSKVLYQTLTVLCIDQC